MSRILITGASKGIGLATSIQLLESKHQVIGIARYHDCQPYQHPNFVAAKVDLRQPLQVPLKALQQQHPDIDVIIANAGIGHFGELEQLSMQHIQEMMQVNFLATVELIKYYLPQMKKRQQGHIILIGSEAGLAGAKKGTGYCASKFALRGFAQALRLECANQHIKVTLINPGFVASEFHTGLNFKPRNHPDNCISCQDIAQWISHIIEHPHNSVLEEINLQPLQKVIEKNNPSK